IQDIYCKSCNEIYTNIEIGWCKQCQIKNFTNWISGNEKIDKLIHEMQLKIENWNDSVIEWIPYNQFNKIKEIGKDCFATIYSAIWIDGPMRYDCNHRKLKRISNEKVALKYLHNSQSITNEFLN